MRISLSSHFNTKKLILFSLPSILMMIFISIYGVVDGFFVSNFAGDTPFAALNFIYPVIMVLSSLGFMFGAGGSALISKTLGEKDNEKANKIFSLLVYVCIGIGVILSILTIIFIRPIAILLGASTQMLDMCVSYARIIIAVLPFHILQFYFQSLLITAEKPKVSLIITLISGCTNMILDALFIAVFKWGIEGAASATAISIVLGGLIPIFYFARKNDSLLRLGKTSFDMKSLAKVCINGSSEFVSNISMSVVSMLYNYQLMKYLGQNGVSAYGTFMYVGMIFLSIYIGYSSAITPIVGYNYGAKNTKELQGVFKRSLFFILAGSVAMVIFSEFMAYPLSYLFVSYNDELLKLTTKAMYISSISFLFTGICIFSSNFFTALNNGLISAFISFVRTLIIQIIAILVLPIIMGPDGIWVSLIVAEFAAALIASIFLIIKRKKYQY